MTTEQRPVGMAEAYAELRRLQALERKQKLAELDATANTEVNAMSDAMALMRDELAEWKARAEEAEATIARVRHLRDVSGDTVGVEELDAALDPKPAFVLPTKAGAVVEYMDHEGGRQRWFRTRDTQRPWVDREGNTWHDAGVERDIAGDFKVLIEAKL